MASKDDVVIPDFVSFTKTWHREPYAAISPTRPELSVSGRNVVVTGGGTGIGKAIAIAFAQAGAASVSILGRRADRLKGSTAAISAAASSHKTQVLYETADLTKRADVDKALKSIVDKVGPIAILVSNAGVLPEPGLMASMDVETFMSSFELNVRGALNAVQAFIPLAAPEATLISINTGIAHFSPMPGVGSYAASKAANLKMMDYIAAENPGLHVINVQPGVVSTEMNEGSSMKGQDSVELPGQFCVWLASPEAKFLKSKYVWVNWDVEELKERADEIKNSRLLTVYLDGVPM